MTNLFIAKRVKGLDRLPNILAESDLNGAKSIVFAVFSRYGDGIVSFKIIQEFISKHPDKQYMLATTPQLSPYAQELIGNSVNIVEVSKRNPVSLAKAVIKIKKFDADIGLNPWSHGDDSLYFISFAKRFFEFKKFSKHPKYYNIYDRVKEYLLLDVPPLKTIDDSFEFDGVSKIVIAPFSTDAKKNMNFSDLDKLLSVLKNINSNAEITIACPQPLPSSIKYSGKLFIFGKSSKKSSEFLLLLRATELFIGVDSGPLHLALCLGKKCIGIFGSNAPETIIQDSFSLMSLRSDKLFGVFCQVEECDDSKCVHCLFDTALFDFKTTMSDQLVLENEKCPLLKK